MKYYTPINISEKVTEILHKISNILHTNDVGYCKQIIRNFAHKFIQFQEKKFTKCSQIYFMVFTLQYKFSFAEYAGILLQMKIRVSFQTSQKKRTTSPNMQGDIDKQVNSLHHYNMYLEERFVLFIAGGWGDPIPG